MKTTWCVGDIHGDVDLMRFIIKQAKKRDLIFFGDLVDSFEYTHSQQLACVQEMLALIQKGRAKCLMGNHEASYLFKGLEGSRCSGWSTNMHMKLSAYMPDIEKLFLPFIYYEKEKVLFTHAGLTHQIFTVELMTLSGLEETLTEWYATKNDSSPYWQVGQVRHGTSYAGGPLWCDWNVEMKNIPGLRQIVGHTPMKMITEHQGDWCIDCLQQSKQVLQWSGGKFQVVTL